MADITRIVGVRALVMYGPEQHRSLHNGPPALAHPWATKIYK